MAGPCLLRGTLYVTERYEPICKILPFHAKTQRGRISCFEIFNFLCSIVSVIRRNKLNFSLWFHCYLIKNLFTRVAFLFGTAELFTDTRQSLAIYLAVRLARVA